MTRPLPIMRTHLHQMLRSEAGNPTVEFALLFPIFLSLFLATFEIGMVMIHQVNLDRAVDLTVRDLRLGNIEDPDQDKLRQNICGNTSMIKDCMTSLLIELRPVDQTTWDTLPDEVTCREREADIDPVVSLDPGSSHEMMLVRVCAVFDPWFPTTRIGMSLHRDELGGYAIVATSAFVNEPS
ncbi:MAG: pilus assembly protein TadE [Rhodobacterales bacterium]|nr:MAG: pilus assembly protein TadE [Rhodobacterales bacterium]